MTATSRCASCGTFVQSGDSFCWSCGARVRGASAQPATAEARRGKPVEIDSEVALALRHAHLAEQRGRLDEAERHVMAALKRDPDAVPALSMLAAVLRARGDLVGSVAAAQRVSELSAQGDHSPGAVARAREDRARIEQQVVSAIVAPITSLDTPLSIFTAPDRGWYRSRWFTLALAAAGALSLFLGFVAVLEGRLGGYLWFAASLLGAGWCYHDADSRGFAAHLWAPFVLALGPFGLALYLLFTR